MNGFIASIHQLDFFLWFGFFNKISLSKKFVVFDNVQAPLGITWFTRSRIVFAGKETWLTLPILKKKVPIWSMRIDSETGYNREHLGTLRQSYLKSFEREGISLEFQKFAHLQYRQFN